MNPGRWDHSDTFTDTHTAFKWGLLPSQFASLSEDDKAYMIAYVNSVNKMEAWEYQTRVDELEDK